jgi:2-oxoglutarate ferredoxin oxidoreductase subunit alpha
MPLVVFIAQRPGPATGLPTWTAQGDLLCAVHAGHGEFPKIILAPGDAEDMIRLTTKAYDLADIYQTPVIILSDKVLSESHESIDIHTVRKMQSVYTPNRGKIVLQTTQSPYLRYKDSPDGISELLVPGSQPPHHWQANSYEHLEDSHTTEAASEVIKQTDKRARKKLTYLGEIPYRGDIWQGFEPPTYYGDPHASIVLLCWGGSKSVCLAAQHELDRQGTHVGVYYFTHVYPLASSVRDLFRSDKRYILVENNSEAQLGTVLRMELGMDIGRDPQSCILRYDGRPLAISDIITHFTSIIL